MALLFHYFCAFLGILVIAKALLLSLIWNSGILKHVVLFLDVLTQWELNPTQRRASSLNRVGLFVHTTSSAELQKTENHRADVLDEISIFLLITETLKTISSVIFVVRVRTFYKVKYLTPQNKLKIFHLCKTKMS